MFFMYVMFLWTTKRVHRDRIPPPPLGKATVSEHRTGAHGPPSQKKGHALNCTGVYRPQKFEVDQGQSLRTPWPVTGVFRARSVPGVSPKTGGVRRSVPRGVSRVRSAPDSGVSKKCSESVPGVSKRCPGHSGTLTLFGHSGVRGQTIRGTLRRTPPVFGDTPATLPGTLRA